MAYQPNRAAPTATPITPSTSSTPVNPQSTGSSATTLVSSTLTTPQNAGLAGSRWASEFAASAPTSDPTLATNHSSVSASPAVQPSAPVSTTVDSTTGLAGSRWAPQVEVPEPDLVAAPEPPPALPTTAASVVTYTTSSIPTTKIRVPSGSGKRVLNEQKVKVTKNMSRAHIGELILYRTDNQAIAAFLQVDIPPFSKSNYLLSGTWAKRNANNSQIVVDGNTMWDAPIEDHDKLSLIASTIRVCTDPYLAYLKCTPLRIIYNGQVLT